MGSLLLKDPLFTTNFCLLIIKHVNFGSIFWLFVVRIRENVFTKVVVLIPNKAENVMPRNRDPFLGIQDPSKMC